jgi:hypothetical protein
MREKIFVGPNPQLSTAAVRILFAGSDAGGNKLLRCTACWVRQIAHDSLRTDSRKKADYLRWGSIRSDCGKLSLTIPDRNVPFPTKWAE